jgi:hypothetical protein
MTKEKNISKNEMDRILSEYSVFRKLLDMQNYDKEYFGNAEIFRKSKEKSVCLPGDGPYITARMFDLRRFVLSLDATNEKLFIFYHYIHGESVGRVAELMRISRRSAFRLKSRALEYAAARYPEYRRKAKSGVTE